MVLFVNQTIKERVLTGDTNVVAVMIGHITRFLELYPGPDLKLYVMLRSAEEATYFDLGNIAEHIG